MPEMYAPGMMDVHMPTSIEDALDLLTSLGEDAALISGGTAMVLMLKNGLIDPDALISLQRLDGLSYVQPVDGAVHIGALTTLRAVETSPEVRRISKALNKAYGVVGNVRVRNAATVGGNLAEADYASDPPAMLVALRASAIARSVRGEREIPLTDLFTDFYETCLDFDEIVTELRVPALGPMESAAYLKFVTRSSEDRPCVGTAAVIDLDDDGTCRSLRVVVGAVAGVPQEFADAEDIGVGRTLSAGVIDEIASAYADLVDPIDDLRGSKWYRRRVTAVFVRRALEAALSDR